MLHHSRARLAEAGKMPTPQAKRINQLWDGHPARPKNGALIQIKAISPITLW